jgi:predicted secreted protein
MQTRWKQGRIKMCSRFNLRVARLCWMVIAAVALTHNFCWAGQPLLILTQDDNGKTVSANLQQSIAINLLGNITTGYSWVLSSTNGSSVVPTGEPSYTSDAGDGVGVGGTFAFPFFASGIGETTLSFRYQRSWETNNPLQTFAVTINVLGPPASALTVALRGTNAVVYWPITGSTGFYLEGTTTVLAGWAALNALPIPNGTNYTVTLPAVGSGLFFRLHR